jgi:stage II sporulation protein M
MLFLAFKQLFLKANETIKATICRNRLILKTVTLAFFTLLTLVVIVASFAFYNSPELADMLSSFAEQTLNLDNLPSSFTADFLSFIFFNNIGHFWNPLRMLVWIPVLGPVLLGFELFLNGSLIGVIAVMVAITNGMAHPILGLVPHGIFEIPAFLLQFTCIILWQVSVTEAVVDKLKGRPVKMDKFTRDLKDVVVLAVLCLLFFFVAALIETFVTPRLLGLL